MRHPINPLVDYAFKRLLGAEPNKNLTRHFLNAILRPQQPIQEVTLVNPFNDRDFAEDKLSVVDDPLIPRGLASRHFDGEGISARAMPIIDAGVAVNLYVDTYYGRKLGLAPTTGSPSNRVVTPGTQDLAALLKEVGSGVYVTSWLGGNSDSTTGDFSLGLRGHLIEGGEIGAPVGEMNVTGNLADLVQRAPK